MQHRKAEKKAVKKGVSDFCGATVLHMVLFWGDPLNRVTDDPFKWELRVRLIISWS